MSGNGSKIMGWYSRTSPTPWANASSHGGAIWAPRQHATVRACLVLPINSFEAIEWKQ